MKHKMSEQIGIKPRWPDSQLQIVCLMDNSSFSLISHYSIESLEPLVGGQVDNWWKELLPMVAPELFLAGGPVIMVQVTLHTLPSVCLC